jgi:hypothetical protein
MQGGWLTSEVAGAQEVLSQDTLDVRAWLRPSAPENPPRATGELYRRHSMSVLQRADARRPGAGPGSLRSCREVAPGAGRQTRACPLQSQHRRPTGQAFWSIGVTRNCGACGKQFEAARPNAKFCGPTCRKRASRGASAQAPNPVASADNSLVKATKAELEAAGKLDTRLGQQALILAARMSGTETPSGVGTLSKELDRVMAAAIGSAPAAAPAPGAGDDVDELRARRDAKRAG